VVVRSKDKNGGGSGGGEQRWTYGSKADLGC